MHCWPPTSGLANQPAICRVKETGQGGALSQYLTYCRSQGPVRRYHQMFSAYLVETSVVSWWAVAVSVITYYDPT